MSESTEKPVMERSTSQRRAIRNALAAADRPLSPVEVLEAAKVHVPRLGIATVYRTLKALQQEGWLETVELPGEPPRYEQTGKGHHHHFHCRACGRVFEIHGCDQNIASLTPPGFEMTSHELFLFGRCDACISEHRQESPVPPAHSHP